MNVEQFSAMMPVISADLIEMIARRKGMDEMQAIQKLYESKLYAALEQEDTKLWHYSTPMLYALLEQEWATGAISYPDV